MTAFLTVRRDMEGYYVKGGVKSRNRRTHRIENDGVVSMRGSTSDIHERSMSDTDFFASVVGVEDRCPILQGATESVRSKEICTSSQTGREDGSVFSNPEMSLNDGRRI